TVGLGIEITRPRYGLWQSFVGVMVSSSSALFDVDTQLHATLMSDMSQDENGFYFTYIIPQNPRQALVEVTYFTRKSLTRDYLTERSTHAAQRFVQTKIAASLDDITITAIEYGHLPMWDVLRHQKPRPQTHHHITLAGNISGALRSSSGYGFATIQRWANQTGEALSRTDKLSTEPLIHTRHYSRWVQWMDNILLVVLVRYPELSSTIFLRMANGLTGSEFAQFMSHRAQLRIWLKVIMAMPKWTFIKAVWWSWID
ncbi:MAG: lycopene cyclase family protein, partial [Glaciecola sp.]|nr:lycopene cyclase family protein [Glaciecola sp.]